MNNKWFSLDNAAKLYPAFASKRESGTFRVAAVMKDNIDPIKLESALNSILTRFPTMAVQIKKGLFWYYFTPNKKRQKILKESRLPCEHINNRNGYLFNVFYFEKRIALECFHALTDGYGAFEFLKTLLYEYLKLSGKTLKNYECILHPQDIWKQEEIEDSYKKYAKEGVARDWDKRAHHIRGKMIPYEGVFVHHLKVSAKKLLEKAKEYNTTLTVLVSAIYIESLMEDNMKNPVVLAIPVNLRRRFKSDTLRNFTYIVNISIKEEQASSFSMLIKNIGKQLEEKTNTESLVTQFSKNVYFEENMLLRYTPRNIKNMIIKFVKKKIFDKRATTILSNPGVISIPNEMKNDIDYMEFFLYASKAQPVNMGICTCGDDVMITMSRIIEDESIINKFIANFIKRTEIPFQYYSNKGDYNELPKI